MTTCKQRLGSRSSRDGPTISGPRFLLWIENKRTENKKSKREAETIWFCVKEKAFYQTTIFLQRQQLKQWPLIHRLTARLLWTGLYRLAYLSLSSIGPLPDQIFPLRLRIRDSSLSVLINRALTDTGTRNRWIWPIPKLRSVLRLRLHHLLSIFLHCVIASRYGLLSINGSACLVNWVIEFKLEDRNYAFETVGKIRLATFDIKVVK